MAILKYKKSDGSFAALTNYTVQPITPVQQTGNSTSEIMSQNAVTVALAEKADASSVYTKTEIGSTFLTKTEASDTYATATTVQNIVNETVYGTTTPTEEQKNADVVTTENLQSTLSGYATASSLSSYVNAASYDSQGKKILLKNGTTTIAEIDATPFIKDGMVSNASVTGGNLVITFNTDAGKSDISIPVSDIFNASNYYTKSEVDGLLSGSGSGVVVITSETISSYLTDYAETSDLAAVATSGSYNDLTDKPTIPAAYTHPADGADTTIQSADGKVLSAITVNSLGHVTSVAGKTLTSDDIPSVGIAKVSGLQDALDAKAAGSHTHAISDVTNLQTTLDGKVTSIEVNGTQYNPVQGAVTLPAYPTELPASDVSAWAKAESKPSYALSEITGASDVQTIEALTGTSGLLRKTAADTWELDTNTYLTDTGAYTGKTSLSSLPVDRRLIVASISANQSFSLAGTPSAGREIHVIVNSTGAYTITLPNTGNYVLMGDSSANSLTTEAGKYYDINIISDGTKMYIRAL